MVNQALLVYCLVPVQHEDTEMGLGIERFIGEGVPGKDHEEGLKMVQEKPSDCDVDLTSVKGKKEESRSRQGNSQL